MTAIKEMAGMDVLCSDKTRTLMLDKLIVDTDLIELELLEWRTKIPLMPLLWVHSLIQVKRSKYFDFSIIAQAWKFWQHGRHKVTFIHVLPAKFAQAQAHIQEVHFLPFNPTNKRPALTYFDIPYQQRCS